jgi:hypothetical protein
MSPIAVLALLALAAFVWFGFLRRKVTSRGDGSTTYDGGTSHSTESSCDGGSDGSGGCDGGGGE